MKKSTRKRFNRWVRDNYPNDPKLNYYQLKHLFKLAEAKRTTIHKYYENTRESRLEILESMKNYQIDPKTNRFFLYGSSTNF